MAALTAGWGMALAGRAAADDQATSGIVVSPFYQNVSLGKSQPEVHSTVTLTNNTGTDQSFRLSTVDFGSLNDSGGVAFLGASTSSFAKKYGLSDWMKLDVDTVTVPKGQDYKIGVSITNSDTLTSGGHYGAILATALTAPNGPAAQPRVGVFEVLSSLILLIKGGGVPPSMSAYAQTSDGNWWHLPKSVTDKFENDGNVHVVPRGLITVKDPLGRVVEQGAINVNSGNILPQTQRKYVSTLMKMAPATFPGTYTLVLSYRYDGSDVSKTFSSSQLYLGRFGLAILIGIVLILALGVVAGVLVWRQRSLKGKSN